MRVSPLQSINREIQELQFWIFGFDTTKKSDSLLTNYSGPPVIIIINSIKLKLLLLFSNGQILRDKPIIESNHMKFTIIRENEVRTLQ
jgi:hypothetical protein